MRYPYSGGYPNGLETPGDVQGHLTHQKMPPLLGPAWGHRHRPTVGSLRKAISCEPGTPVYPMVATSQLEVQDQPAALFAEQKEGREDAVDQVIIVPALGPARGPSDRYTVGWWGLRLIELDMPVYVHIDHPRPLESSASLSKPPSLSLAHPARAPSARAPHFCSLHVASALTMAATCSCRVTVRSCSTLGALSR